MVPLPSRRTLFLGVTGLILSLAFIAWDGIQRSRHLLDLSADYGVTVDAPTSDVMQASGYANGRRSLVLPTGSADSAHWIAQTQSAIAEGPWRIRSVDYDNAPDGREVHWASPFRLWLVTLASVDHALSGRPLGISVERATLWSGPLMLLLALPFIAWGLHRWLSPWAAIVLPFTLIAYHPFFIDFLAGRADHHGFANLSGALCVVFFLVGALQAKPRFFALSASMGALGLWISAVTLVPVLLGLGLGIVAGALFARNDLFTLPWLKDASLLRYWARWGAAGCAVAYLLEYAPGPFTLRLEVNHPWYALAWWGGGEVLRAVVLFLTCKGRSAFTPRDRLFAAMGAVALVSLPAAILITRDDTFTVINGFLLNLHQQHISEFQSLFRLFAVQGWSLSTLGLLLPLLAVITTFAGVGRKAFSMETRAMLLVAAVPVLLTWALGLHQVRWLGLALALSLPLFALGFRAAFFATNTASHRWRHAYLAIVVVCFLPGFLSTAQRTLALGNVTQEEIRALAERDLAHWLRLRMGDRPAVIAASPGATTRQIYFGSHHGLGTLYWENLVGLQRLAAFYAATTEEEAWRLAREAGLTHVIFLSWDAFEVPLIHLHRGKAGATDIPSDAFFVRLLQSPVPPAWLRAVPFPLPAHPSLKGAEIRIWQVVEPRSPARALSGAIHAYLESGRPDLANRLAAGLERHPDELSTWISKASLAAVARNQPAFVASLQGALPLLPQANTLTLGERLQLVSILGIGQDFGRAREQLLAALAATKAEDVRGLTMGQLEDLLSLCDGLAPFTLRPDLRDVARELLPPARRP